MYLLQKYHYLKIILKNFIWRHFLRGTDETAVCKVSSCKKILKINWWFNKRSTFPFTV